MEGVTTPVREIFAQIYEEKVRTDELAARLLQLEDNGVNASEKDMCAALNDRVTNIIQAIWSEQDLTGPHSPFREGPTLMDRLGQLLDEKVAAQQSFLVALDTRQQALNKELAKLSSGLSDRQEKLEGEQRVEILKFR
eukprot:170173-Amphidinium_carterae.1